MRDRPAGTQLMELLDRVREGDPTLVVPDDGRYRDLMVARAEAIVERQQAAGDRPEQQELAALSAILGRDSTLAELNRTLARAIRGGDYDSGSPESGTVRRHLWQTVIIRVGESNPKALEAGDEG